MRSVRLFVVLFVVGMLTVAGTIPAAATSATDSTNPDVTVSVSVSPDTATAGDTVTASASLTNNTSRRLLLFVRVRLEIPGLPILREAKFVVLRRNQTVSISRDVTVQPFFPLGTYSLTVTATGRNGTSSATATFDVV